MLIKKVYRFCNENNLAIMFKFIEEGIDKIEVSLDEENWYNVEFEGDTSSVRIFQGFNPMQIVTVYYRWYIGDEMFSNNTTMVVNPQGYNMEIPIEHDITPDFRVKPKSGTIIEQINTIFLVDEGD
jgi:hypothetical protein